MDWKVGNIKKEWKETAGSSLISVSYGCVVNKFEQTVSTTQDSCIINNSSSVTRKITMAKYQISGKFTGKALFFF